MRIKKEWSSPGASVRHMVDAGDGMYSVSEMPATVALEIAQSADDLAIVDIDGVDHLRIAKRSYVPAEVFDLQGRKVAREGEEPEAPKRARKRA